MRLIRLFGALLCCAASAAAQESAGWQALQRANDDFGRDKARLAPLRVAEPERYAGEWRALLERHEAQVAKAAGVPQALGARQSLAREYYELGALLRFGLKRPDDALAAYAKASKVRPADAFDVATLAAADTWRFDKKDARRAIEHYRLVAASLADKATWAGGNRQIAEGLRRWVDHEIAYLEHGRRFSGAIARSDMGVAQLWVMAMAIQEPQRIADAPALAALPPSQHQLARVYPVILEFEPAEMLAFFERHDPAGYLTAALLAGARIQMPSPFVNAASERFFASRGIRLASASADPRYASPQKTWAAFIAAAKRGDAARMLDCFTPDLREQLGELFKRLSRDELRAMGASFVAFEMQGESEALIVRQHPDRRQAGFVHFVNDDGAWKIASM